MGKLSGFIDYKRALPILRPPQERVGDWNEFHQHLPESVLREQAGRCMDCGVPFCYAGGLSQPLSYGCPLNNLIPDWNDLVYKGDWQGALDQLHRTNNFPEFTGRVCPAPCEGSCVLGINDQPVTIKEIECAIVDHGFDMGWIGPRHVAPRSDKSVAIIGSGPAGLACAAELNRFGHSVTVFEKEDRVGGLLMYGIPNMKLDKSIVTRRVNLLEAEGVAFVTNVEVGRNYPTERLLEEFDATVICIGSEQPRDLLVENRNAEGIHFAMNFLRENTRKLLGGGTSEHISVEGKDVVVIGGGDTGTDCVGTALRQGCRSLVQFEILPQPDGQRSNDNPWPQWPKIHRTDYGQEEAICLTGEDPRQFSVVTKKFVVDNLGHVCGVQTSEIEWGANEGVRSYLEVSGSERTWPAQLVLLAMGFTGPRKLGLVSDLGLTLTERGTLSVDEANQTSRDGIFAAGDVERGQSLVVWAIAAGRKTAVGVHEYLARGTH